MSFNMDFDKIINAQILNDANEDAHDIILLFNKYGIYGFDVVKFSIELSALAEQIKCKNKQNNNE